MIEVYDPGHGGKDPGAVGPTGLRESFVVADVAVLVAAKRATAGAEAKLTRGREEGPGLSDRARLANRLKASLFVSIHCNAAGNREAQGIETWYHGHSAEGKRLATCLYEALIDEFPEAGRRGVQSDTTRYKSGFAVLRETVMPAALVELEFISHPEREREMGTTAWRERAAAAIARGVEAYLKHKEAA
ncbi:MAG: N-acetylmuramoyl-L-alanine amidase family protein [Methanocella sp.]